MKRQEPKEKWEPLPGEKGKISDLASISEAIRNFNKPAADSPTSEELEQAYRIVGAIKAEYCIGTFDGGNDFDHALEEEIAPLVIPLLRKIIADKLAKQEEEMLDATREADLYS